MAQTTKIPITAVAALLIITIMLTGSTTNIVSVWAGTFPGPNGQIAFVSLTDGNDEIYVMNADGSDQTNLSNNDADDFNPSWSPDGEKIAFSGSRDNNEESGSNFDIFVMNADDGSGQTRLTNNDADDSDLDWGTNTSSPDGDGNGSSTTTSQQASDEVISANTDHNTNYNTDDNTDDNTDHNTDDNNHDILGFLIAVVQCFTDNDEEFSDDVQLCLYGVIDDYFDNVDNNLNNDNDGRDYNNNNNDISSNDNNNNGTSSQET
jgi:TolB protein